MRRIEPVGRSASQIGGPKLRQRYVATGSREVHDERQNDRGGTKDEDDRKHRRDEAIEPICCNALNLHRSDRITPAGRWPVTGHRTAARFIRITPRRSNVASNLMDFCFNCGNKTDPDWVFCRSCGSGLDVLEDKSALAATAEAPTEPKVELISRRWDIVDIDTVEHPKDPSDSNVIDVPLPPEAIEVSAGDITVIATPTDNAHFEDEPDPDDLVPAPGPDTDRWDHLRPHTHLPPAATPATAAAAVAGQISVLSVAVAALVATILRFYLNTRLEAFGDGTVSARALGDFKTVADASLVVMLGLAVIAAAILGWWMMTASRTSGPRPGSAGIVAAASALGGATLVAVFYFSKNETVADAIAANSLTILGLGLVMMSCLATVRTVGRIEEIT